MATVKFYLKKPSSSTETSICLKFTLDRNHRIEIVTGERILPRYWNGKLQEVKPNYTGHLEINQSLDQLKNWILQFWREHRSDGFDSMRQAIRDYIKNGVADLSQKKSLSSILEQFIQQYKQDKDFKTTQKFRSLRSKLEKFNPSLKIDALDFNFYDSFKAFLYSKPGGQLFDTSVFKYFVNLKTLLTWAIRRGFQVHQTNGSPTHEQWEIIKHRYPPISLRLEEVEKLENLNITPEWISTKIRFTKHMRKDQPYLTATALAIARDYLVLECRTGQRISDLKRFDLTNVEAERWIFHPKKGNRISAKTIYFPFNTQFTRPAWRILQRYNFKLPAISEKNLNLNIKTICMLAGIDQPISIHRWRANERVEIKGPKYEFISTHTGRKTFITIALQFMPPKLVKDIVGIESYETLKHYEDSSENSLIERYFNSMAEGIATLRRA